MPGEYETKLHRAIAVFKTYQQEIFPDITEENDNGEWVFGDEFNDMKKAYLGVIKNIPYTHAADLLLDELLYAIARDNECSSLISETLHYPGWFALLCQSSIQTNYINAKWQFAEYLRDYRGEKNIKDLIFHFLAAENEYTERMALQSLPEIYPEQVEKYAVHFWNRQKYDADEYQKMMALYALHRVKSPLLEHYLIEAEKTDYKYLINYTHEIRDTLN